MWITLCVIAFLFVIGIFMEEHEQRCTEKENKIRHMERTKERVKDEFEQIERMCAWPCEEIIEGLERYIDRMIRISTDSSGCTSPDSSS